MMTSPESARFSGLLGNDYALFMIAYPHFHEMQRAVACEVASVAGERLSVLEIGCGPGPTSNALLAADSRISLTCIDNEEVMLEQARRCLRSGIESGRVQLVQADALEYLKRCGPQTYHAFASGWTLHNFKEDYRRDVHDQLFRVLRPGGLFVNGDKYALNDPLAHARSLEWSLNRYHEVYTPAGHTALRDQWMVHMIEDNQPGVIMREGAAMADLERAGFVEVRTVWREQMEAVVTARKKSDDWREFRTGP